MSNCFIRLPGFKDTGPGKTSFRDDRCCECGEPLKDKAVPFVCHSTDGGFGGPWHVACAIQYGFGDPDPHGNWIFIDAGKDW